MKTIFSILTLALFVGCGSDKEAKVETEKQEQVEDTLINQLEAAVVVVEETPINEEPTREEIENPYERLKGTYWMLTYPENSDPIIYHWCEAEVPHLNVGEYDGVQKFSIMFGQDSQIFKVLSISGETYEMEQYRVAEYTLQLAEEWNEENSPEITILVNEDTGSTFVDGMEYTSQKVFIRDDFSEDVEHQEEDCGYMEEY